MELSAPNRSARWPPMKRCRAGARRLLGALGELLSKRGQLPCAAQARQVL